MKAILIDDEKPALLHMERLLAAEHGVRVEGKFTSAQAGIEYLERSGADVVFLDIEMPGMNGLEAAERILQIDDDIRIVYVTAYADYAVEAFERCAMDYLLKPIHPDRIAKTVRRIEAMLRKSSQGKEKAVNTEKRVCCLKRLALYDGDEAVRHLKWRTSKSQELFAFLLHRRDRWVSKDLILDTLWPDTLRDKAMTHLHTSVYQIRKLLKQWGVQRTIEYELDSYRLRADEFQTDVQLLEAIPLEEPINEDSWEKLNRITDMYSGDYLEEHDYVWAASKSKELLSRYLSLSLALARYEMQTGRERMALQRLLLLQEKEPYSEEICELVLSAYARNSDYQALQRHYDSFVELFQADLGRKPDRPNDEQVSRLIQSGRQE
ncbi:response regulator [Paenibacillus sp. TAB 01]|uniref:response regulator n=1 Tax=Paenibacillus sp. TAB 01 TaxID=3368988 RepID=UPI003751ADDE